MGNVFGNFGMFKMLVTSAMQRGKQSESDLKGPQAEGKPPAIARKKNVKFHFFSFS